MFVAVATWGGNYSRVVLKELLKKGGLLDVTRVPVGLVFEKKLRGYKIDEPISIFVES